MSVPLMPKATAVWLIENTSLTFEQIADFAAHPLEVKSIADGEVAKGIIGVDPITSGQLTIDEIKECEKNPNKKIKIAEGAQKHIIAEEQKKKKSGKYTPIARRQDKPDAIAWILKNCSELTESQIVKLIGTTKSTVAAVKNKTHWNIANIRPKDPVLLGLCSQIELDKTYELAKKRAEDKKRTEIEKDIEEKSKKKSK